MARSLGRGRCGLLIVALGAVAAGCGYSLGYRSPPGAATIGVPIFHNSTFALRREVEYDLTRLVRREIQARTNLVLAGSEDADLVLRGNIVEFAEDLVVEGKRDRKVESTLRAVVDVTLEDHVNGYRVSRRVQGQEPFTPALGESFEDGRRRALENLAERIVAAVEYWDDYDRDDAAPAEGAADGR